MNFKITKEFRFYAAVFMISAIVMGIQILQSRLFSVTTWYHLSFLVISIAMFGLTLGALHIYAKKEEKTRRDYSLIARKACYRCGISIVAALAVQLLIPLVALNPWHTLLILPFVATVTGAAYYFAGIALTVSLTRAPYPVGKTYGFDLIGAAAGCLGALALMNIVDTPSGLGLLGAGAAATGLLYNAGRSKKAVKIKSDARLVAIVLCIISVANALAPKPFFYPLWAKNVYSPHDLFAYETWNAISRITVTHSEEHPAFLWGASRKTPNDTATITSALAIDNEAGTHITKLGDDLKAHSYLQYDMTNLAYSLPNLENAAIIGVGGGRDVLSAKYFGVKNVVAMDVNPVQVDLLTRHPFYKDYAGLHDMEGVKILNSEARSWFRQNEQLFDLIEMSLIDTWAASGAGAFALSENGLYTREAWSIFFHDLSPHGVFTVSRWSVKDYWDDTARLLALGMATLFNEGVKDSSKHIFLSSTNLIVTLIVSKSELTNAQIDALENTANKMEFKIIASPRKKTRKGVIGELLDAHSEEELNVIAAKETFDISPPTDMRPFFFNQARFSMPGLITKLAFEGGPATLYGQAKATFNLFMIIGLSALAVILVILLPIARKIANAHYPASFVASGSAYFFLIGLGFMLLEVSLLQAFGVYLGHPVYGLSIVLFSLILSTGAGSFLSEKFPLRNAGAQVFWALAIFGYAALLAFKLDDLFTAFAEVSLVTRGAVSVGVLFPAGLLLGYAFPTGIRMAAAKFPQSTSWFWGINGAAGVLGSALAIALNIGIGIDKTLLIAGFVYLLLVIPMVRLARDA